MGALGNGDGAEIAAGGKPRNGDGFFYEPTILVGIGEGTRVVDEEQFGPALPVLGIYKGKAAFRP